MKMMQVEIRLLLAIGLPINFNYLKRYSVDPKNCNLEIGKFESNVSNFRPYQSANEVEGV
jgi:hypothetical protein